MHVSVSRIADKLVEEAKSLRAEIVAFHLGLKLNVFRTPSTSYSVASTAFRSRPTPGPRRKKPTIA
jgi:hypothetical protein